MSLLSRVVNRARGKRAPEGMQSADEVISRAVAAAGPEAPGSAPMVYGGVQVARGKTLRPLGDRIAVEPISDFGKIGDLFIPTSQTYSRARVVSRGSKVKSLGLQAGAVVVISEFFGAEVKLEDGTPNGRRLRVGRVRDIVGVYIPPSESGGSGKIFPVLDRVLAKRLDPPKMAGKLHLPQDVNEKQFKAEVIQSGVDCAVRTGDIILVPKQGSASVDFEGHKYILIEEPSIIAILK